MVRRGPGVLLISAALAGCGGGAPAPPPELPAVGMATTVLRLPARGGSVLAYSADSLEPTGWQSAGTLGPVARPLGYDLDQRMVFLLDPRDRLLGLDLDAGISRVLTEGVRLASVGPDGAAYAVDTAGRMVRIARRAVTAFPARFDPGRPPDALFGTLNGQVTAAAADTGQGIALRLLSVEQSGEPIAVDWGPAAATTWGEVVAVAHERRVRLIRPADPARSRQLVTPSPVRAMVFSPSGHRLYLLTEAERVEIVDRFSTERLGSLGLPGPGEALRADPTGRWLLVRPEEQDSVWVLDAATGSWIASLPTAWGPTLPQVGGASVLLAAEGADVVSWNLAAAPAVPIARVSGGARDTWLALPWVPPQRVAAVRAAAESAMVAQDSLLSIPFPGARSTAASTYVQVSSSQNRAWSEELADQLRAAGFRSEVWPPSSPDDGFRVVVGPWESRDAAEEAGRRLGRPFFILSSPPPDPDSRPR